MGWILCVLSLSRALYAQESQEQYYITVSSFRQMTDAEVKKQCAFLHNSIVLARQHPVQTECSREEERLITRAKVSRRYIYHFFYRQKEDGSASLGVNRWTKVDGSEPDPVDFTQLKWTIEAPDFETQKIYIQKAHKKFFEYHNNERAFKEFLALTMANEPGLKRVLINSQGQYIDTQTNQILSFDEAYNLLWKEKPKFRFFTRATIEMGAILGIGMIKYWLTPSVNSVDWDYRFNWENWRKRLLTYDAWRFDDNRISINTYEHVLGGVLYYFVPRSLGASMLESFLFALAASAIWELLIEFREVVSVNDMIFTPVGGMALGEVLFQLSKFFQRGSDTAINQVLSSIFGVAGVSNLNAWVSKNKPRVSSNTDRFGFPSDVWHKFDVFSNFEKSKTKSGVSWEKISLGFDTKIIDIPGAGQVGNINTLLTDGGFTRLVFNGKFNQFVNLSDFLFFAKTSLIGYYRQSITKTQEQELKGYSFFIGTSTAIDYHTHLIGKVTDRLGIVNVLGPSLDLTYYSNGYKIRCTIDVFGDFAAVRSFAIDKFIENNGESALVSVLKDHHYYFAFGITANPRVEVSNGPFEMSIELKYHWLTSVNALDRFVNQNYNNINFKDSKFGYKIWLGYTLPWWNDLIKVGIAYEQYVRQGSAAQYSVTDTETIISGQLMMVF